MKAGIPGLPDNSEVYDLVVDEQDIRLDKYVADKCAPLSRTRAQKLISDGYVLVNGSTARAGLRLNIGDRVTVTIPPDTPGTLSPQDIPLNILYQDDDLLVIDKPAGLTVHPAPGHPDHTLVNAILSHLSELPDTADSVRPGIVHRLDKDTSGLILVARNSTALANLSDQFKNRTVVKAYLVLVKGLLTPEQGIIEAPVGRDSRNRKRMAVTPETRGRQARTQYQVVKYFDNYTLLEAIPQTGRTHQIRVHLAAIGYPVVGDATYGVKSPHLTRQFLHASRLGFHLPSSGEYLEFESPLPAGLAQALQNIT